MKFSQIDAYAKAARKIGYAKLEAAIFLKSLGNLVLFRKTKLFKEKSLAELEKYLSHKYLEYDSEKEVNILCSWCIFFQNKNVLKILESVLWWLNYNLEEREAIVDKALALVDWRKIRKNQIKFLLSSKIVQKSANLQRILIQLRK